MEEEIETLERNENRHEFIIMKTHVPVGKRAQFINYLQSIGAKIYLKEETEQSKKSKSIAKTSFQVYMKLFRNYLKKKKKISVDEFLALQALGNKVEIWSPKKKKFVNQEKFSKNILLGKEIQQIALRKTLIKFLETRYIETHINESTSIPLHQRVYVELKEPFKRQIIDLEEGQSFYLYSKQYFLQTEQLIERIQMIA